jgi:hypothetical protein
MRGHLTDREMMELIASALEGATVAHLRGCEACRKECARLHTALVDLATDARARAERSAMFFQRQRVRIGYRAGDRRLFVRRWRSVWAPALATGALVAVFLTRGGTPPRSPDESEADQALLSAVQHAIHREAPVALSPAALLVAELERGARESDRGIGAQKGDQP